MGHLSYQALSRLPSIVDGIAEGDIKEHEGLHICEACVYGKQARLPFTDSTTAYDTLELMHSDICGPMHVPSLGKAKHVLTFIDHKSQYPYCAYMSMKDAATCLEEFKAYKAWIENKTNKTIKIL